MRLTVAKHTHLTSVLFSLILLLLLELHTLTQVTSSYVLLIALIIQYIAHTKFEKKFST